MQISAAAHLAATVPRLRLHSQDITVSFIEGWGLYAEWLGVDMVGLVLA